ETERECGRPADPSGFVSQSLQSHGELGRQLSRRTPDADPANFLKHPCSSFRAIPWATYPPHPRAETGLFPGESAGALERRGPPAPGSVPEVTHDDVATTARSGE